MSSAARERGASARGSPPGWGSLLGAQVLHSPWTGATNAFSVLPRRCYALQKSKIQPCPFSAVTAPKQQHLHAGYPIAPTGLAGAGAAPVQFEGWGLGLGLRIPPGDSRRCEEKGSLLASQGAAGCRMHQSPARVPGVCVGGSHRCPHPQRELRLWQQHSPATSAVWSSSSGGKDRGKKVIPRYILVTATPAARGGGGVVVVH